MVARVKVSSRYQIAVPSSIRKRLKIESGDTLLMEVYDGHVVLIPEPRNYAERLRGLHSEVWSGIDTDEYLRGERDAWRQ